MHRQRFAARWAAAAVLAAAAPGALAAACPGPSSFGDVDQASVFCTNIEWIKNRAITLGCVGTTLYCPNDFVLRSQMAAFMNRLGDALTPVVLSNTQRIGNYDLDTLESNPDAHLCKVGPFAATGYPRRAIVYAQFSGYVGGPAQIFGTTTLSTNGGAFARTAPGGIGMRAQAAAVGWTNVTQTATIDLDAGSTYTFAFLVVRAVEDTGTGDVVDLGSGNGGGRCNMTVQIGSRSGATAPF